ncbi:MAG TPA: hypothetical protein VJB57_04885 [Dehalococcoidia bacterium]|nr:hypothetical protein [Dehalococcoidia bacterium]
MPLPVDLYLMTLSGLVKARSDGKGSGEILHKTLDPDEVREVVSDPLNPRRLYAATFTDIYVSEDDGETWQFRPAGGLIYREICALAAHPTKEGELYVGTAPPAVFRSEDAGMSFTELVGIKDLPDYDKWTFPPPPHLPRVRRIGLDARRPDEVVIGIEEGGVARSHDRGETWEDISGPVSENTFGMPNPKSVRPGYRPGIEEEGVVYRDVHEFVFDPTDAKRIYATTGRGTYRTDDAGNYWRMLEYGISSKTRYAMPIAIDCTRPERLYVGFASGGGPTAWKGYRPARTGLYWTSRYSRDTSDEDGGAGSVLLRSTDGGDTWEPLTHGLPERHAYMICGIQVDPNDPESVYAAYTDGSVYHSKDAGESWNQILQGVDKLVGLRIKASGGN